MRLHKALRFYGFDNYAKVRKILERLSPNPYFWQPLHGSLTYPVFLLKTEIFYRLQTLLDAYGIEYDDVSPSTDDGQEREYPPPKRVLLEYRENNGEVSFEYREYAPVFTRYHASSYKIWKVSGVVPSEIVAEGPEEVKSYAEEYVTNELSKQRTAYKALKERDKNINYPLEFEYKDGSEIVKLKGRIVSTEDTTLRVRLDEPYKGENFIIYGFASAMSGRRVYDKDGSFTQSALENARGLLLGIYKKEKNKLEHGQTIQIVNKLNQEE